MRLSLTNLVCVLFDPAIPTSSFNFIQLFLYLYHSEFEGVARERRWYMNGVSWANKVYLFNILTVIGQCNQQTVYFLIFET